MNDTLQQFLDTDELTEDKYDDYRGALRDTYRFYVMNPRHTKGVEYSLWIVDGGEEYPILSSNTGGFTTFHSRSMDVGNGLKPTETFFDLVGGGFHEAMCFTPRVYFEGEESAFERTYMGVYGDKPRGYEVWAAAEIISYITTPQTLVPEVEPIADWAGRHSEFGVPILGDDE